MSDKVQLTTYGDCNLNVQVQQFSPGRQLKISWLEEMVSAGVVRHRRTLPPHAGGGGDVVPQEETPSENISSSATVCASAESRPAVSDRTIDSGRQRTRVPSQPIASWLRIPLRECARNGNDDGAQARALLDAGAATEDTDRAGRTALHWAAARGNVSVVQALLDAGANSNAYDGAGSSPLHCAARAGHVAVVEALLDWGRPPREHTRLVAVETQTRSESVEEKPAGFPQPWGAHRETVVDARNAYGSTALHRAAFNGRDGVVSALLKRGAGVGVLGRSGRTALHLACRNMHLGCVEILLAAGAFESAKAKDGSTPWSELTSAAEDRKPGNPSVERIAVALRRAYERRAWGRRGWLVMLKAAWERRNGKNQARDERGLVATRMHRIFQGRESFERAVAGFSWVPGPCLQGMVDDDVMGSEAIEEEVVTNPDLGSLVSRLLDLGEEGTFRLVISFL